MYYIFNSQGELIATSSLEPNLEDLASRGEQAVQSEELFANPVLIEGEIVERGIAPSAYHQWNGTAWGLSQEAQTKLLAEQQAQVWEQIKQKRTENGRAGVFVASVQKWFHTDDPSRAQYTFMRTLPSFPETLWKTMDNSFVKMNRALLDELSMAMFAHEQADFANAERHRLQMLKANDPLAYDFSDGWANTYQEAN